MYLGTLMTQQSTLTRAHTHTHTCIQCHVYMYIHVCVHTQRMLPAYRSQQVPSDCFQTHMNHKNFKVYLLQQNSNNQTLCETDYITSRVPIRN